MKIKSVTNVITNSSSETFLVVNENAIDTVKNFINAILETAGSEKTCDDLFDVTPSLCEDIEEKINDAKNESQFYLTQVEEQCLRKKLAYYIDNDIKTYYILGSICEKLKIKGLDREWIVIKINEFSSLLSATSLEIIKYLDILIKQELLFKSPIQSAYKLTFSDEDVQKVKNEISQLVIENPDKIEVDQSLRPMSADMEEFEQIPEAQEMKNFLNQTINYNEKISHITRLLPAFVRLLPALCQVLRCPLSNRPMPDGSACNARRGLLLLCR